MCGIAGFWRSTSSDVRADDLLRRMADVLHHRGPDDSGTYHDAHAGVGFTLAFPGRLLAHASVPMTFGALISRATFGWAMAVAAIHSPSVMGRVGT